MLSVEGKSNKKQKINENSNHDLHDTSVSEEDSDTKRQVYIFFDFECTQDDLVECADGYKPGEDNSLCSNCG
jgi:hypothetical protein